MSFKSFVIFVFHFYIFNPPAFDLILCVIRLPIFVVAFTEQFILSHPSVKSALKNPFLCEIDSSPLTLVYLSFPVPMTVHCLYYYSITMNL